MFIQIRSHCISCPWARAKLLVKGEEKNLKGSCSCPSSCPLAHGFSLEQLELGPAGNGAGLSAAAPRCLPFPTAVPPALQKSLGCSFGNLAHRSSVSLLRALLSLCDPCSCCFSSLPLPGGPRGSLFELLVYFVTFSRVGLLKSGHTLPLPPSRPILSVLSCPAPLSLCARRGVSSCWARRYPIPLLLAWVLWMKCGVPAPSVHSPQLCSCPVLGSASPLPSQRPRQAARFSEL